MSTAVPTMRGLPSRSIVTPAGTSALLPVSIAGEPGLRRRSPAVVGALVGSIGATSSGSAAELLPAGSPPCTML
jgi:hypothetical protein